MPRTGESATAALSGSTLTGVSVTRVPGASGRKVFLIHSGMPAARTGWTLGG